ncbi:hypothetical protein ACYSNO_00230 [Enterococcus sp. LJL98]
MFEWTMFSLIVLLISLGILVFRLMKEFQLQQVKKKGPTDLVFKKKLAFVKQKQYYTHMVVLMLVSLLLTMSLIIGLIGSHQMKEQFDLLQKQQGKLEKSFKEIEQEKVDLVYNLPVSPYPTTGIGLKNYDWEAIIEGKNKEKQLEVEIGIAQSLMPYFGVTNAIVVFNTPTQTLHMNFIFDLSSNEKQEKALKNLPELIQELEGIESINQVNIQMKNLESKALEQNEFYIRSNVQEPFKQLKASQE